MNDQSPQESNSSSADPTVRLPRAEAEQAINKLDQDAGNSAPLPPAPPAPPLPPVENPTVQYDAPIPAPQAQQQAPTYAAPAAAVAPSENPLVTGIGTLWAAIAQTWQGNTVGALRAGTTGRGFALVATLLYAVIGGLMLATVVTRGLGGFDDMLGSFSSYATGGYYSTKGTFSAKFGIWIGSFFLGAILFLITVVARALCVKWVFAVRGASQKFDTVLRLTAVAYAIPMALLLVATVFMMIPSLALSAVIMFVIAVVSLPVGMIPELLIYVGINRTHRFTKSPLIPHVSFSLVWVIILAIAYMIVFSIVAEMMS